MAEIGVPPPGARLGPIRLSSGVSTRQALSFVYISLVGISIWGFIPLMLPYVLTEQVHAPAAMHGRIAGTLQLVQTFAAIVLVPLLGGLADKYGRRWLLILAMAGFTLAAVLYPSATTLAALVAFNLIAGIAQTGNIAGGATSVIDYPENASRGKWVSLLLVGQVLSQIPGWLNGEGFTPVETSRIAFWTLSVFTGLATFAAVRGIKADRGAGGKPDFNPLAEIRTSLANLKEVITYARRNPRFRLVLLVACVMRSDFAIVATFLSLWVAAEGRAHGVDAGAAMQTAGNMHFILMIGSFLVPLAVGFLVDRLNRILLIMLAVGFCTVAFLAPAFVGDVFGWGAVVAVALIGLGEGAIIVTTNSLLGQEAPEHLRGSALGIFILLGLVGVAAINFVGGQLFDRVSPVAPFVLVAAFNALILVSALPHARELLRDAAR